MEKLKQNPILRAAFSVTGVIVIAKLLGFVKQMVVASHFGATIETDLINLSQGFIGDVETVFIYVLLTSFTSIYIHTRQRDEQLAKRFTGDALAALSLAAAGLAVLVALAAPLIAGIIAPTYTPELRGRLAGYLRLFAPILIVYVWTAVCYALQNAHGHFVPGQMTGANQSVILIAAVLLLQPYMGVKALVVGFFCYGIYNAAYLMFLSRKDIRLSRGSPFASPELRRLLLMSGPLFLSNSMIYVNNQVDRILASGLRMGMVTVMYYAATLANLVTAFIGSFCSIMFTYITTDVSRGEHRQAAERSALSTLLLVLVFLPVTVITMCCSQDIVAVVFGRGAYTEKDVADTALALTGYAFMFVPLVLREQFSRFQCCYQDSKRPMINSIVSILANIVLSIVLSRFWGVFGITFATSVSTALCGVLNAISARKLNESLSLRPLLDKLPLLAAAGVICYFLAMWMTRLCRAYHPLVRLVLTALCALAGYFLAVSPMLIRLLKDRTADAGRAGEEKTKNKHVD